LTAHTYSWSSIAHARTLKINKLQDLNVVLKFVYTCLHVLDSFALTLNELFLLLNVSLDSVEEQVHGSASVVSQNCDSIRELLDGLRSVHGNFELSAFVNQKVDSTFCFVAHFEAESVRQAEQLL